jgi:hypothetical protein
MVPSAVASSPPPPLSQRRALFGPTEQRFQRNDGSTRNECSAGLQFSRTNPLRTAVSTEQANVPVEKRMKRKDNSRGMLVPGEPQVWRYKENGGFTETTRNQNKGSAEYETNRHGGIQTERSGGNTAQLVQMYTEQKVKNRME